MKDMLVLCHSLVLKVVYSLNLFSDDFIILAGKEKKSLKKVSSSGGIVTKHDSTICGRKNASKVMEKVSLRRKKLSLKMNIHSYVGGVTLDQGAPFTM